MTALLPESKLGSSISGFSSYGGGDAGLRDRSLTLASLLLETLQSKQSPLKLPTYNMTLPPI